MALRNVLPIVMVATYLCSTGNVLFAALDGLRLGRAMQLGSHASRCGCSLVVEAAHTCGCGHGCCGAEEPGDVCRAGHARVGAQETLADGPRLSLIAALRCRGLDAPSHTSALTLSPPHVLADAMPLPTADWGRRVPPPAQQRPSRHDAYLPDHVPIC